MSVPFSHAPQAQKGRRAAPVGQPTAQHCCLRGSSHPGHDCWAASLLRLLDGHLADVGAPRLDLDGLEAVGELWEAAGGPGGGVWGGGGGGGGGGRPPGAAQGRAQGRPARGSAAALVPVQPPLPPATLPARTAGAPPPRAPPALTSFSASSLLTLGAIITSSPCLQSAGVATGCLAASWSESMTRSSCGSEGGGGGRGGRSGLGHLPTAVRRSAGQRASKSAAGGERRSVPPQRRAPRQSCGRWRRGRAGRA